MKVLSKAANTIRPPSDLNMSDWADENRILSPEASAQAGKWRTDFAPYVRDIMNTVNDDRVHTCVWMASAQVGKTEVVLNTLGYFVDQDAAPILCLQPTVDMASAFSNDRLRPMIRDCPTLSDKINLNKRGGGNTVLHKSFAGGHITLAGANSPASLASRPVRVLLGDEIDRYEASAGSEGDPVLLAQKRTTTFYNRFHFYCSTPGNAESSRIEPLFLDGDQRRYMVACPHCGTFQVLRFPMIRYDEKDTENTTYYECEECEGKILDKHKRNMLNTGHWKAHAPFNGIASFHIWEAYSPWVKFHEVVDSYLKAKDNPEQLKVWINTSLGETYAERGDAPEWKRLYERREAWDRNIVPKQALRIICSVDVQGNRLEAEVKGFGRNGESWCVDYFVFEGDTSDITTAKSPWRDLEKVMDKQWKHGLGGNIGVDVTVVDSSDQTMTVYIWARRHGTRVMCIKGRKSAQSILNPPTPQDIRKNGKKTKKGIMLYIVGTDIGKTALYGRLKMDVPDSKDLQESGYPYGFLHFNDWQSDEYFKQICAEQRMRKRNKRGYWETFWHKLRDRNEALDINVYAMAAYERLGIGRMTEAHWEEIETRLGKNIQPIESVSRKTEGLKPSAVAKNSQGVTIKRREVNFMNKR